ncbi:zinc finger protein-like 1 homolog [Chelonus insularis]|uniref:zinc finger protein-like 1 homolog n=1 Tax=Chelonus insularis TaxID=460826 RepID=UPI0015891A3B|nr:zinc finger protein-like 1 homolog [Chelonus insularis]
MGLCKCPKRTVTNQFCFEHRVNVCEHCMVSSHPKCIVQSYIQWLKDSDYDSNCTLCSGVLENEDCVRLTCYHVFHWSCLDRYARSLPPTTAPAGYICPTCQACIFPRSNLVSPVADVLKEKLVSVNWARAGLDLPLLSSDAEQKPTQEAQSKVSSIDTPVYQNHVSVPSVATARTSSSVNSSSTHLNNLHSNNIKQGPPYSVVNMESSHQSDRKVFEAYDDPKDVTFDHDENKYQRKSAFEWFLRWWKLISRPPTHKRNSSGSLYKRYAVMFMAGLLFFIFIIIIFSWLGRIHSEIDPEFDIMGNPNLNLKEQGI